MNKLLIAAAISSLFAASAFAGGNTAPVAATAGVFGNVNVNNTVSGGITVVNGGFSVSQASDTQSASAQIGSSVNKGTTSISSQNAALTSTDINATVANTSSSSAWNYSSGNSNGTATVTSGSGAVAGGNAAITNVATGSGYIGVGETTAINAGSNMAGGSSSAAGANFDSAQTYDAKTGALVGVGSTVTAGGYAQNADGVLPVSGLPTGAKLVAPSVMSVGDSVTFSASGTGSTGINSNASFPRNGE